MFSSKSAAVATGRPEKLQLEDGPPAQPSLGSDARVGRATRREGTQRAWWRRVSWWAAVPVLLYILLVLFGVSQSSIGIDNLREDPANPTGVMLGGARPIRSDEYLTSTPLAIGVLATGSAEDFNPLTGPQGFSTQFPSTPVSSVVLFDGTLLRAGPFLPDQMLFAARWWLPFLLLFLGAPALFKSITGSRWVGLFAAGLMVASPAAAWWSFGPIGMLGFTIAGAAAMHKCIEEWNGPRRRWRAITWGVVTAILLARTPLHYQPWAIVVAPVILVVAIIPLLMDSKNRKSNAIAVGGISIASLALAGMVFIENRASVLASVGTVYPGARVSGGLPHPFEQIFGATALAGIGEVDLSGNTNQSEVSTSFAIAAVLVVLLVAFGLRYKSKAHRWALLSGMFMTGLWFMWCMVDFGSIGTRIPIVNMVPSGRAAGIVGFLAIFLLALALPALKDRPRRGFAFLCAATMALVAGYAGSLMRSSTINSMTVRSIWLVMAIVAVVVFCIVYRPRLWFGYVGAFLAAALLVWNVNPVLFGLADLRGSAIAGQFLEQGKDVRESGNVWASDDPNVDALMIATGVPALSGRQLSGPDHSGWEQLDPSRTQEDVWNRGGSYIHFVWNDDDGLRLSNPVPDMIQLEGNPCQLKQEFPSVSAIISSHELSATCLVPSGTFTWDLGPKWIYTFADN